MGNKEITVLLQKHCIDETRAGRQYPAHGHWRIDGRLLIATCVMATCHNRSAYCDMSPPPHSLSCSPQRLLVFASSVMIVLGDSRQQARSKRSAHECFIPRALRIICLV
jgi:hypothetical protein